MTDESKPPLEDVEREEHAEPTGNSASTSPEGSQGLSDDEGDNFPHKITKSYFSRSIPSTISGKQSTIMSKMIYLCTNDLEDPIFAAEIHMGFSDMAPLGHKPGVILYDGIKKTDRIMAAAGYKSMMDARISAFSIESDIWLPQMSPEEPLIGLTAETMRAHKSADGGVTFTFSMSLDIPRRKGSPRLTTFQWRKVSKQNGDGGDSIGGFNLLLLPAVPQQGTTNVGNHSGSSSGNQNSKATGDERIVASFSYAEENHRGFLVTVQGR